MSPRPEIRVLATSEDLFRAAAIEFVAQAQQAVASRERFTVVLSGGSTPKGLYSLLAGGFRSEIPWPKIFFFWGDERHVPPSDPESNYRMANEVMLSKVPVPGENVFRIPAEDKDANSAAAKYERTIRQFFQLRSGELPRFDLILLGMGPDGHTASLFPGTAALREQSRLVVANWVEKFKTERITLTLPVLNNARNTLFMVAGSDKAQSLREVLEGSAPAEQYPSKLIRPVDGTLVWLVDEAAGRNLSVRSGRRVSSF